MTDAEYDYLLRDADPRWKAYYRTRREEYRKKHPRTNFDKWKEGLEPDEFALGIGPIYECSRCPLAGGTWEDCKRRFGGGLCRNKILAWAAAPAKEEEK